MLRLILAVQSWIWRGNNQPTSVSARRGRHRMCDIGVGFLTRLLHQAGVSRDAWLQTSKD